MRAPQKYSWWAGEQAGDMPYSWRRSIAIMVGFTVAVTFLVWCGYELAASFP